MRNTVGLKEESGARNLQTVNHLIGPAVICAADLDDALCLCGAACNTDSSHNGLSARTEHTEHLDVGHMFVDLLSEQELTLVEQTGYRAAVIKKLNDLLSHGSIVAAEDCRAACLQEVVVLVAVKVIKERAFSLGHANREGIVESEVVLNAAGDILLCLGGDRLRLCALGLEIIENVFKCLFGNTIDRLRSELVKLMVNGLCVFPFADSISVAHDNSS